MNIQYDNYSLFIPYVSNTLLSQKMQIEKNLLLVKAINKYGTENITQLIKFLNIFFNIKYFNCKYDTQLEKQSKLYFSDL